MRTSPRDSDPQLGEPVSQGLPAELHRSDIRTGIVRALLRAYEHNVSRHNPSLGDDPLTFGMHVWKSGNRFLREELQDLSGTSLTQVHQSLEAQVGRCRLRPHKLGDSETDDPYRSFPQHVGPATRLGRMTQLRLDLFDLELSQLHLPQLHPSEMQLPEMQAPKEEYLDWVIGHYGSATSGLRAVRLQAVGAERAGDGTISRWEAVDTLFEATCSRSS